MLAVSDPCFEVWLIDHVRLCPETVRTSEEAHDIAVREGVVCGKKGKYICEEALADRMQTATDNASCHKTPKKQMGRNQLNGFSTWAPWTDMDEIARILDS